MSGEFVPGLIGILAPDNYPAFRRKIASLNISCLMTPLYSGLKLYETDAYIVENNLFPPSSGVSEWASKRMNERSRVRERSKQGGASESTIEWTSEWPSTTSRFLAFFEPLCAPPLLHKITISCSSRLFSAFLSFFLVWQDNSLASFWFLLLYRITNFCSAFFQLLYTITVLCFSHFTG